MPQTTNKLSKLIGQVDLMVAAAEPGVVLSSEMCEVGVETLLQIKKELLSLRDQGRNEDKGR